MIGFSRANYNSVWRRVTLIPRQMVTLNGVTDSGIFETTSLAVGPQVESITVQLRRPTTAAPLAWSSTGTLRTTLVLKVDTQEYRCIGQVSGGIRTGEGGVEASEYSLKYSPPVILRDGVYRRIGETRLSTTEVRLILELLSGSVETEIIASISNEGPVRWQ
jgi:hypothetical protein